MEENQEININLEKMIRKVSKVAKDKYLTNKAREERKLNIKTKKKVVKPKATEDNTL
jgi:ElaB/YqjD/DUF883 family membrane-anchored ribosome-binding protein